MNSLELFQPGDRVRHPAKPEWGLGRVLKSDRISHEGRAVQRVVVEFPNHGRATINTAFAPLVRADAATPIGSGLVNPSIPPGPTLEQIKTLPQAATDALASLASRFAATLNLYSYSTEPRSLMDWAVARTRADDPLSHFTRHELEQAFSVFAVARDKHLRELVRFIRKAGEHGLLREAASHSSPAARRAVEAAIKGV